MIDASDIVRLRLGYLTIPAEESAQHAGQPWMVCAYAIRHPKGVFLFDTGIAEAQIVDELFRAVRWPLAGQLRAAGIEPGDVKLVANCHLHFDHSGGNRQFAGVPILAQRVEHETAATVEDYTVEGIAEFPGAAYELLDGEAQAWPGITVLPTPGHTAGHQSLLVETRQGRVLLAGQAVNLASDYAAARFGHELRQAGLPAELDLPAWIGGVAAVDPWRVLFAHDLAVVERSEPIPADRASSVHGAPATRG